MTPPITRIASLLLFLVVASATAGAWAQGRGQGQGQGGRGQAGAPAPREQHDRREDHRALSDAVRRVERRTGGQVLSAERVPFDGRNVNRVKVVDSSGRVRVYMDDPQGGRQAPPPPRDDRDDD